MKNQGIAECFTNKKYIRKIYTIIYLHRWLSSAFALFFSKIPIKLYQKNNFIIARKNQREPSVKKKLFLQSSAKDKDMEASTDKKKINKNRYFNIK